MGKWTGCDIHFACLLCLSRGEFFLSSLQELKLPVVCQSIGLSVHLSSLSANQSISQKGRQTVSHLSVN